MKKFALLSMLLSLGLFVAGCGDTTQKPKPAGVGGGGPPQGMPNTGAPDTTTPDATDGATDDADMKDGADATEPAGDTDANTDTDANPSDTETDAAAPTENDKE